MIGTDQTEEQPSNILSLEEMSFPRVVEEIQGIGWWLLSLASLALGAVVGLLLR